MKKIRILSDLHLEFCPYVIEKHQDDWNTILVLAGDIAPICKLKDTLGDFLNVASGQFEHVVYVAGNHEYYKGDFDNHKLLKKHCDTYSNIHFLEMDTVEIGDISFIGATLWTDFDNGNQRSMNTAHASMSDFSLINNGSEILTPYDTYNIHMISKEYIFKQIEEKRKEGYKTVVVTHHLPSNTSINTKYLSSAINGAFCTDMTDDILKGGPDVFIHGHTHDNCAYRIGRTMVYCNPRGYIPHENNCAFNPLMGVVV